MIPAPYYHDESGIALYCGRSEEIAPLLQFRGLVLTDPPYGIAHPTNYAERGRSNLAKCRNYERVRGDESPFDPCWLLGIGEARIIWGGNYFAHRLPPVGGWLVWDKERPDNLDQATCELAWTDCVKGVRRFRHLWNGMMRASGDAIFHPTQKPVALMRWCLSLRWTRQFKAVLDPYAGSGSTLEAAKLEGCCAIGIEQEESYCEKIATRLSQMALFSAQTKGRN